MIEKIKKDVNKIEIFKPKRTFLRPVNPDYYLRKGQSIEINVSGIKMKIENTRSQHVYVRLK